MKIFPSIRTLPLPSAAQELFSRAVRLVLDRPTDFESVGRWLDQHYSEEASRRVCEEAHRLSLRRRLHYLQSHSATYNRRRALRDGRPLDELKRERIAEALGRGQRLSGRQVVTRHHPEAYPDEKLIDETNVEHVFAWEDEQYRQQLQQIKNERKTVKVDEFDHPEKPGWRLTRAVNEIIEAGYPVDAPSEHVEQSRKIVGLATLLVWPGPLYSLGEFGRWKWDSEFIRVTSNDWLDNVLAVDPDVAKAGPHPFRPTMLNPRSVGREEALFTRNPDASRTLNIESSDLDRFCALLSIAVDEIEQSVRTHSADVALKEMDDAQAKLGQEALATDQPPDYIDLDQAAALVNRHKRTLERRIGEMPLPAVQGAGGKKSEWLYATLRPWLEKEYGRVLPTRPPHVIR